MAEPQDSFEEPASSESQRGEPHLAEYWEIVLKRRKLILVCVALALAAGVVMTMVTKPEFRSTSVLDVVRQTSNPLGFSAGMGYAGPDPDFLPSQTQLMQSREIAERVVRRLNLLANPDFNPRRYTEFMPDARGNVRKPTPEEVVDAALKVQGSVEASIVRGTSLVEITCTAASARLAADLANAVGDSYIDWNADSRYRLIGQSAQFLTAQIEQAKSELEAKEKELLAYGREKEMVTIEPQMNPALQKLESSNRDLAAATADRVAKEARYEEIRSMPAEMLAESTTGGMLMQMRGEQQRLEREYADKLSIYKPELPAMQQLKLQIDRGRQNLETTRTEAASKAVEAARTEYLTALRREGNLKGIVRSSRTDALAQGGDAVEYKNLRVEIDTKRALLDNLLKQQGETEVIARLQQDQVTNVRVVDRALPPGRPFKPSYEKNLLIAGFLGVIAGVGLAFLMSYLDRSLRTPEQVEQHLQLPALGVIPAVQDTSFGAGIRRGLRVGRKETAADDDKRKALIELLPHGEPRSPISEAYRAFRTALLLSRAGGVRSIVVTSAFPREGKTATAVNLAIVLGQLGRRVLLVDADLHKSRMHEVFEIPNRVGLVSILAENLEPSRAIVKTTFPGVFVVPSGPETPNPSGLLSSDAMRKFLELASTNFDHVIVDTPPILLVSDTLVFAQQTDGVVLCVRGGVTPRDQAMRARDRILRSGVLILGVLINALEPEDHGYYAPYAYEYGGDRPPREGEEAPPPSVAARAPQTSFTGQTS